MCIPAKLVNSVKGERERKEKREEGGGRET